MANTNWPTYLLLGLYVLAMFIVTIIANRKNKAGQKTDSPVMGHFLAFKTFGSTILFLTTFATVFSGYTVVGVPNEAGRLGFTAIRWVGAGAFVAVSILMVFPRLRRLSMVRKYESPGDFIRDRFNRQPLSALITMCLCVPQLLYIAVNVLSLGTLLEALTGKELSFYAVIAVSVFLILVFEALGGLRSVAYTDTIQATVMLLIFVIMPIIIGVKWGGFTGQVSNATKCSNFRIFNNAPSGCLRDVKGGLKGFPSIDQYYFRTPSALTTINFVLFSLSFVSFALNPHLLQRAFTAKHDNDLKTVLIALFFAPFITMIPGLLTGITFLTNKTSFPSAVSKFPPFMGVLAVFQQDSSGFVEFISYVAMIAGVSGIMSTADSALIGVSNTVSVNIFKNWLTPHYSHEAIVYIGKAVSLCTMLIAIGIAIHLYESGIQYGVILTLQQAILWQAFPAYVFGLYTNISYKSVLFGVSFGVLVDIVLISLVFGNENGETDPLAQADKALIALEKSWSSLIGVALNVVACCVGHWCLGWGEHDETQEQNRGTLTYDEMEKLMENVSEPMRKCGGILVYLPGICGIVGAFHWMGEIDPALTKLYGSEKVRSLVYNGKVAKVIGGMPSWAFATLMWYVAGCALGVYATALWNVDADEDVAHTGNIEDGRYPDKIGVKSTTDLRGNGVHTSETAGLKDNDINQFAMARTVGGIDDEDDEDAGL